MIAAFCTASFKDLVTQRLVGRDLRWTLAAHTGHNAFGDAESLSIAYPPVYAIHHLLALGRFSIPPRTGDV
jgi:hypothetical protein